MVMLLLLVLQRPDLGEGHLLWGGRLGVGGGRLRLVPAGRAARAGATTAGGASVEDHTPWRKEGGERRATLNH